MLGNLKTWQKVTVYSVSVLILFVLGVRTYIALKARQFIGMEEKYGNSGFQDSEFEKEMRSVGFYTGASWCMYFALLIWKKVFPNDWDKISKILNGATQESFNKAKKSDYLKVNSSPRVGDIAIWQNVNNPSFGHAGVVTKVRPDYFKTVEGNTNTEGSREGTTVDVKKNSYGMRGNLKLRGFIHKPILGIF